VNDRHGGDDKRDQSWDKRPCPRVLSWRWGAILAPRHPRKKRPSPKPSHDHRNEIRKRFEKRNGPQQLSDPDEKGKG
jgi:hypothetical protein